MAKYYYENLLSNQNVTATTNVTWVADLTTLRLFRDQKAFVFLCVDIHTNYIVAALISKQTITTQSIIRSLERSIHQRLKIPGKRNLIIHTDRGTQFSSKSYNTFTKKHNEYFTPSMARQNTPTYVRLGKRLPNMSIPVPPNKIHSQHRSKEHRIGTVGNGTIAGGGGHAFFCDTTLGSYHKLFNAITRDKNVISAQNGSGPKSPLLTKFKGFKAFTSLQKSTNARPDITRLAKMSIYP